MDNLQFPREDVGSQQPERYIPGVQFLNYHINHDKWDWFKYFTIYFAHYWEDDFCQSLDNGVRWDVNTIELGSGSASYTCTDMVNGVLLLTNDDADGDQIEVAQLCECWQLPDDYPLYCEMRFKLSDASHSAFWFGLVTGQGYFTPPDDFAVFEKDGTDVNLEFSRAKNGVGGEVDTGQDLEDDTWYRIGFHFDGDGTIRWFVYRDSDRYCLQTGSVTTYIPDDVELSLGFGIQNLEAVAKSMYVDYVRCTQKRVIE